MNGVGTISTDAALSHSYEYHPDTRSSKSSPVNPDRDLLRYLTEVPPEQWERIRLLLGHPPSEEFLATIRRATKRGLPESRRRPVSSDAPAEQQGVLEIVVAYCNGATPETIAAACHSTERSIRDTLQQAGVILRDQAHPSAEIRDQVRALHAQGLSMREIARRYGVAHTTISRLLRDGT